MDISDVFGKKTGSSPNFFNKQSTRTKVSIYMLELLQAIAPSQTRATAIKMAKGEHKCGVDTKTVPGNTSYESTESKKLTWKYLNRQVGRYLCLRS